MFFASGEIWRYILLLEDVMAEETCSMISGEHKYVKLASQPSRLLQTWLDHAGSDAVLAMLFDKKTARRGG